MLISEVVSNISARMIDAVKVNKSSFVEYNGEPFWLKQRRFGRSLIIVCGNLFLKLSNSQIIMFAKTAEWQLWEVESYKLLYGITGEAAVVGSNAIRIPHVSGRSLKHYLEMDSLTPDMISAAAVEFRRAHRLVMSVLSGEWSHGDPHLQNVLYDSDTNQAHLIDFETRHELNLSVIERHADDLLVFLLDLLGRSPKDKWLEWSTLFLTAYSDKNVLQILSARLEIPKGFEAILWKTRTNYLRQRDLNIGITELKDWIDHFVMS